MTGLSRIIAVVHTENQTKATCDLFGTRAMVIEFQKDDCIPNRWIRFWTKVFFNSKWTLLNQTDK